MGKINCIIIDENNASRKTIEQHIEIIKYLRLTHSLSNPAKALEILKNDIYKSIIFIDITMKGIDSNTFFDDLKPFHMAIITTDKRNDAIVAYENGAIDFLLKPVSFSRFLKAATKAHQIISQIKGRYQESGKTKSNNLSKAKPSIGKYIDSPLTNEQKDKLYNKLIEFVENEKYFINTNISVRELALKINSNRSYVSQAINDKKAMTFNRFINEYRVKETIRLLMDPGFDGLSIEGVASSVGFVSKSSFYSAFRKITGLTPAEYRKLKKEKTLKIN
ncbi:Protein-glutamate methylesterase/protein-glutamine glutaminase [subsurface metagenome]